MTLLICPYEEESAMTKSGGLLQLVAVGKQDVFLTGNPQVSWFKQVYRRYTNYALESKRMYFDGSPDFGQRLSCLVPRAGDLLGRIYLEVELPAQYWTDAVADISAGYVNSIGHALIEEISIQIGEQEVDKQTGEFMQLNYMLSTGFDKLDAYRAMIGEIDGYPTTGLVGPLKLTIPLQFWFNKSPGLYLPLLALQYHPVRINIKLRPLKELIYIDDAHYSYTCADALPITTGSNYGITKMSMWGDYVYLDVDERRRFVSSAIEYLITQVQYTPKQYIGPNATAVNIPINFNHPLKELVWVLQRNYSAQRNEHFNYSNQGYNEASSANGYRTDMYVDAKLQLDGDDRFDKRDARYFTLVQPFEHHTAVPYLYYLNNYCFAFNPEDMQPSGSLNASRIDDIKLVLNMNSTTADYSVNGRGDVYTTVYGINNNVLRVVDGFGGVLYSV